MTTFSASLITNLTALLPQSRDCSCYVSYVLTPPPFWLQKHTDLRAHDLAHSHDLWHEPTLTNVTCAWSWTLCGIIPAIHNMQFCYGRSEFQCGSLLLGVVTENWQILPYVVCRGDVEKAKRKVEGDLKLTQEAVSDLERNKKELEQTIQRKDKEISSLAAKLEDEQSLVAKLQKQIKELQVILRCFWMNIYQIHRSAQRVLFYIQFIDMHFIVSLFCLTILFTTSHRYFAARVGGVVSWVR